MVEGIDAAELVRQRSMSHEAAAEAWCDGAAPSLSREESEALDGDRELAIAALEHAAERLQQQALREQHKLLREKERRSASCGGRGSQSSPGSHSNPAHAYESPGSLAATSSSCELARHAARTPNTATLSSPTVSPRHECISDD